MAAILAMVDFSAASLTNARHHRQTKELSDAAVTGRRGRALLTPGATLGLGMSRAKLDGEDRVQEFLTSAGLRVQRFSKAEMRQGRTPDFRVFAGDELAFYCEVKTAQDDEWLDRQLDVAPPGTLVGGLRPDPTYNRISNQIHSAVRRFNAVNPAMDRPNVLAIVNGDVHAGRTDLIQVVTGNAYCEGGEVIPMFREYSEGRIREEKLRVHLYLWFNDWKPGRPEMFFPKVHAAHHAASCRCFGVDPAALKRLTA
jgi:hypothetical protein